MSSIVDKLLNSERELSWVLDFAQSKQVLSAKSIDEIHLARQHIHIAAKEIKRLNEHLEKMRLVKGTPHD